MTSHERTGRAGAGNGGRRAVFLDRDGTIIEDTGFVDDPARVRLAPGAADALARLRRAGFFLVVASNQSGVARGLFSEATVRAVNARIQALLGDDARIDAFYWCPELDGPEAVVEQYRRDSDWRKPRPGMLLAAAREHTIDLRRSWMIGDAPRDVEAGRAAGCRTILLAGGDPRPSNRRENASAADFRASTLSQAADLVEQFMDESPTSPASGPPRKDSDAEIPERATAQPSAAEITDLLRQIRDQLDRSHRRERQADFSFLKLLGTLMQLLAVVAGLWGVVALVGGDHPAAAARLLLGCLLQFFALAVHLSDRR